VFGWWVDGAENVLFGAIFATINLPGQARGKRGHREKAFEGKGVEGKGVFLQAATRSSGTTTRPSSTSTTQSAPVRKTPLFEQFVYKNDHFTKTGSGQT
jgi:hypothetical protein